MLQLCSKTAKYPLAHQFAVKSIPPIAKSDIDFSENDDDDDNKYDDDDDDNDCGMDDAA